MSTNYKQIDPINATLPNFYLRGRRRAFFYTHDISDSPSKYGCTPDYFESVVAKSFEVGGIVFPVKEVVKATATSASP